MSRYFDPSYAGLEAYTPGEQPQDKQYIKLNTNESPYPPAPAVVEAIEAEQVRQLRLYPDPACKVLKEKLAAAYGVQPENVFVSNGSDDILNFAFMAYAARGRKAYFPDISYGFYSVFADLYHTDAVEVPLTDRFTIDLSGYRNDDGMVCIANPNAPTGIPLSTEEIRQILEANPSQVVLIDEAYVDFGGTSVAPLIHDYDNLLVIQTFSKSRSMAGARLGFAIASAGIIDDLLRIKFATNPYNINRLTQAAAIATLEADGYYKEKCQAIMDTRAWTTQALEKLGFTVLPSMANFLFVATDRMDGGRLYEELKARGILVRHFTKPRIANYNRITIGTPAEMETLIETIQEILSQSQKGA